MRVALFGLGSIGARHASNLKALGHEPVVIDTDPKRAKHRTLSAQCGQLDAAIIATPAETHLGLLRECIAWGLPVLVEKPLGRVEDLEALRALRPIKPAMVGYQLRFHPEIRRIQPLLSPAAAGVLRCADDARTWPGSAGRGEFLLEFSHEIDLALHCGAPRTVSGILHEHRAFLALGSWSVTLENRAERYERSWEIFDQPRGSYRVAFQSAAEMGETMYRDELEHFLRVVKGERPVAPGCTLEEGIAVLDVIRHAKELG